MQRLRAVAGLAVAALLVVIAGCASGSSGGGGNNPTNVTVTFTGGTPLAVATQVGGSGAFTATTPGNTVTISLPAGKTQYAIAYICPPIAGMGTIDLETVIEATMQDATSFTASCESSPSLGTVTGSASSAIAGAADIEIRGAQGFGSNIGSASGSFNTQMPTGTNDVAAVAVDSTSSNTNVLGVDIVRSQTSPGSVNGGAGIIVSHATTAQSLTVTNIAGGFNATPEASVEYHTGNGTRFLLTNVGVSGSNPEPYQAVAAAVAQSGDFYSYESNNADLSTNQAVGITQTTTSGGGPFSLALPTPWSFNGPSPATLPTFTFVYSGFNGLAAVADQGSIDWQSAPSTITQITVLATANFQGSATTITFPDLTSISGFFQPAAANTTINWVADIFGGTAQEFTVLPAPPANASIAFVQNRGSFTQP